MKKEIKVKLKSARGSIAGYSDSRIAKKETDDCVVRAIAAAIDVDYDTVHQYVAEQFNRKPNKGVYYFTEKFRNRLKDIMGREFEEVGEDRVKGAPHHGKKLVVRYKCYSEIVERKMTFKTFLKNLKNFEGVYILVVYGHTFCLKDGVIVAGNSTDTTAFRRIIESAFRLK